MNETMNRAHDIAIRADELGIDPFTAYTIADDAIDHLDPDDLDSYHNTDPAARQLLAYIILHFTSDDDFDDLRHELRHEWNNLSELDKCEECGASCDLCCDC